LHKFVDAQEMAKRYPAFFEAPSNEQLDSLKIGDIVKVCHNEERFWTIIKSIGDDNKITAIVDNDLVCNQPFKCGDEIQFMKCHIFRTY
jgi:hypothetical protein